MDGGKVKRSKAAQERGESVHVCCCDLWTGPTGPSIKVLNL
jgi:hypothetical protein